MMNPFTYFDPVSFSDCDSLVPHSDLKGRHMKTLVLTMVFALSSVVALAAAPVQTKTQICLDVSGSTLPVVCTVPSSRLDRREYHCQCPQGLRVDVDICPTGVKAPIENLALDHVRRVAARDGSLLGDRIGDRPICVDPRNP